MRLSYPDFIAVNNAKGLLMQYYLKDDGTEKNYFLFSYDSTILYQTRLNSIDDPTNTADFEANYLSLCNKPLDLRDKFTGKPRIKEESVDGVSYNRMIYCTTGDDQSLDQGLSTSWSIVVESGITTLSYKPSHGYYIDGGLLRVMDIFTGFIKADLILAPNIPEAYGGNFYFLNNKKIRKKDITDKRDTIELTRPPKYIPYVEGNPYANEIVLKLTHDPLLEVEIEAILYVYR